MRVLDYKEIQPVHPKGRLERGPGIALETLQGQIDLIYKKAFLSDQCKEIEENNRMGKTKDLFKKIRDTKGTFHAKILNCGVGEDS